MIEHDATQTTAPERTYRHARPKGFCTWSPHRRTRDLLGQVNAVLDEYSEHLPVTARQLFYRLVATTGYDKTEAAYARLCETLNRARRARLIPFSAIRDDGGVAEVPGGFGDTRAWWEAVRDAAGCFRRDRLAGQRVAVEVWVEAAGMLPQLARVADGYGVAVYASGGFNSLTQNHEAARRIAARDRQTVVLHVGDHDPSGVAIFDAAAADVRAFCRELRTEAPALPQFERVVVTPAQVERYGLPEAPPKPTDRRGDWRGGTVQAESMPPDVLAQEVEAVIRAQLNLDVLEAVVEAEAGERGDLVELVNNMIGGGDE